MLEAVEGFPEMEVLLAVHLEVFLEVDPEGILDDVMEDQEYLEDHRGSELRVSP